MKTKAVQFGFAMVLAGLLVACGGGGGGSSSSAKVDQANEADGLGAAGHAPGTVELGDAALPGSMLSADPKVAIALSDQGRALAVWQVKAPSSQDNYAAWAQTSASGDWGAPSPLPQVRDSNYLGLTLKMNQAGNAVLGWRTWSSERPTNRVARFIQGIGWEQDVYDASGSATVPTYDHGNTWDLAILDDDSVTSSVNMPSTSGYASAVLRTDRQGQQTFNLQSTNSNAFFSTKPDGNGLLYHYTDPYSSFGQLEVKAQLASIYSGSFGAFTVGTYPGVCSTEEVYDKPLVAAVTPKSEGVLAVLAADMVEGTATCNKHNLQLNRIYTDRSIRVDSTRLNAAGTYLPVSPVVAVDQFGNALAIWKESTGTPGDYPQPSTKRLMWSQSFYGGTWSEPAPLIPNLDALGIVPRSGHISLAMNANGEAVASVRLDGLVDSSVNQSIVIARFNFASGWSAWRAVANKQDLSEPQVAINAGGQAVLAYTAWAVPRVNGKAPRSSSGEPPVRAFAYRF